MHIYNIFYLAHVDEYNKSVYELISLNFLIIVGEIHKLYMLSASYVMSGQKQMNRRSIVVTKSGSLSASG